MTLLRSVIKNKVLLLTNLTVGILDLKGKTAVKIFYICDKIGFNCLYLRKSNGIDKLYQI